MSSVAHRPSSQPPVRGNHLSNSASPQKGYKTRVIYKNMKVEDDEVGSLYQKSYNKTPQARPISKGSVKPDSARMTLADLSSGMKRNQSSKTSLNKTTSFAVPQSQEARSPGLPTASSNMFSSPAHSAKSPNQDRARSEHKCNHVSASPEELVQKMYESQLLKDTISKEFAGNPNINVNSEADYYEAVKRLDICGKCWTPQIKYYTSPFKVNYKGPGQSLYQKDFVKHPLVDQGPVLKNDFYTTWVNNEPMDFGTTMKNDYKPWAVGPVKKETMNWRPATSGIPFAGASNYKSDYPNWGANKMAYEKAPQQLTTIKELPFNGRTTYGENFAMPDATCQLKPLDKKNAKSPITTGIPFLGETTHGSTYKPFKVAQVPSFAPEQDYEPTQALPEHMRSLYAKDFTAPKQWKCPAAIFIETNPHPKFKYLNQ